MPKLVLILLLALMVPAHAEDPTPEDFVESNIIAYFYHELGHAVIDLEAVPVFGQEEDAADVFAIFMIDALFENDEATEITYDTALGFLIEADDRQKVAGEIPWWDTHGPDEQRFFNTICLFYGANPKARKDLAKDLELPDERAQGCAEEYDLANESWGPILDSLQNRGQGTSVKFIGEDDSLLGDVLKNEVAELNKMLSFKKQLVVKLEDCGEANAFYSAEETSIIFCTELEDHLFNLHQLLAD